MDGKTIVAGPEHADEIFDVFVADLLCFLVLAAHHALRHVQQSLEQICDALSVDVRQHEIEILRVAVHVSEHLLRHSSDQGSHEFAEVASEDWVERLVFWGLLEEGEETLEELVLVLWFFSC